MVPVLCGQMSQNDGRAIVVEPFNELTFHPTQTSISRNVAELLVEGVSTR